MLNWGRGKKSKIKQQKMVAYWRKCLLLESVEYAIMKHILTATVNRINMPTLFFINSGSFVFYRCCENLEILVAQNTQSTFYISEVGVYQMLGVSKESSEAHHNLTGW
jgi:hypothetical protein